MSNNRIVLCTHRHRGIVFKDEVYFAVKSKRTGVVQLAPGDVPTCRESGLTTSQHCDVVGGLWIAVSVEIADVVNGFRAYAAYPSCRQQDDEG